MSIGFDVSKETIDVALFDGRTATHVGINNSESGFAEIVRKIGKYEKDHLLFTMEATGVYHQRCAEFFNDRGYLVSVVNPLIVKRYADMRMTRAKTDKIDAKLIAQYGWNEKSFLYKKPSENSRKIKALLKVIESLNAVKIQNRNRMEALNCHACNMDEVTEIYSTMNKEIKIRIKQIESRIHALIQEENSEEYENLMTIPGVGKRLASAVIGHFGLLEDFESAKQVASFIGANPFPRMSGTSVRGKGTISRKGNGYLRKLFYLAALSAYKHNKSCEDLYERLILKGKAKKVALMAVANKLIRQVFAVVKYNRRYDPIFVK